MRKIVNSERIGSFSFFVLSAHFYDQIFCNYIWHVSVLDIISFILFFYCESEYKTKDDIHISFRIGYFGFTTFICSPVSRPGNVLGYLPGFWLFKGV